MLMLSVATLALTAATQATASLGDDATLVARAQAIAASAADQALVAPCDSITVASVMHTPRIDLTLADRSAQTLRLRTVTVRLQPSPFARRDTQYLALSVGRVCP